jgi:hypothetical protein
MRVRLSIMIALALQVHVATPAPAQETTNADTGLLVYSKTNFGGQQTALRDDTPDLKAVVANDTVSSLKINGTDRWEICEKRNYRGHCAIVSRSEPDMNRMGWHNRVSSARRIHGAVVSRTGYSLSGIELFSEPSYRGHSTKITKTHSALADSTARVGSVRVRGATWELCELARFRGRCVLVAGDIPELRNTGLQDHIRSLRLHVNLRRVR